MTNVPVINVVFCISPAIQLRKEALEVLVNSMGPPGQSIPEPGVVLVSSVRISYGRPLEAVGD